MTIAVAGTGDQAPGASSLVDEFHRLGRRVPNGPGFTPVGGMDFERSQSRHGAHNEDAGKWTVITSAQDSRRPPRSWGGHGYALVPGDYGDGQSDYAVYSR